MNNTDNYTLEQAKQLMAKGLINPVIESIVATEKMCARTDGEPTYTAADILNGMSDRLLKLPGDSFNEWNNHLMDHLSILIPLDNIQRCMGWIDKRFDKLKKIEQKLPQELTLDNVADLIEYLFGQKPKQLLYCGTHAQYPLKQVTKHILPDLVRMMMQAEANYYRHSSQKLDQKGVKLVDIIPLHFSLDEDDLLSRIAPTIKSFNDPDKRPETPYQLAQLYVKIAHDVLFYDYEALSLYREASCQIIEAISNLIEEIKGKDDK